MIKSGAEFLLAKLNDTLGLNIRDPDNHIVVDHNSARIDFFLIYFKLIRAWSKFSNVLRFDFRNFPPINFELTVDNRDVITSTDHIKWSIRRNDLWLNRDSARLNELSIIVMKIVNLSEVPRPRS